MASRRISARRRLISVAVAALLGLMLVPAASLLAAPAMTRPGTMFQVHGGEIFDAQGRSVYFRGVNISGNAKISPDHLPFQPEETVWWDHLREWGFNLARFCVFWEGIEPEKGVYDAVYIDKVRRLLEGAARRGIYVIVDMHQDIFSRWLHGDGAPAWAVKAAGVDPEHNDSFGGQFWSWSNIFSSDLRKCITNFWQSAELEEHYTTAFVELAKKLKDNPYILGYDVMNEPSPGDISNAGGAFENGYLKPFYEDVITALRRVDPDAMGFIEPMDQNFSVLEAPNVDRVVYAPHMYDSIANSFHIMILPEYLLFQLLHGAARNKAKELGEPLLIGEFGAPWTVQPSWAHDVIVDAEYRAMEGGFTSNTLWDYSVRDVAGWNEEDYSIIDGSGNPRGLNVASRPYARRLGGVPVGQSFNRCTRAYELEFDDGATQAPTIVHVPASIQYPRGFRVWISDGRYSFDRSTGELTFRYRKGAGRHKLVVTPAH
jgi:endoglycosylceramidase